MEEQCEQNSRDVKRPRVWPGQKARYVKDREDDEAGKRCRAGWWGVPTGPDAQEILAEGR